MDAQQKAYLLANYNLEPAVLDRLIGDIWAFTQSKPEAWIQKRHSQLQTTGLRNEEIYQKIAAELAEGRFAAPTLSIRQIRRIVYG